MDYLTARRFIETRLQPDVCPELCPADIDELMALAVTADADGYDPSDTLWTPTYTTVGCYRAIAEGWQIKHGRAIPGGFDFATDGQSFRRSQMLDHIEAQRRRWAAKVSTSVSTGSV